MESELTWAFRVVVLGLAVWAVKGYVAAVIKRRKAGDQVCTSDEIDQKIAGAIPNCEKEHEKVLEQTMTALGHRCDLIQKDLEKGSEKMAEHTENIKETNKQIQAMVLSLDRLTVAVNQQNGKAG